MSVCSTNATVVTVVTVVNVVIVVNVVNVVTVVFVVNVVILVIVVFFVAVLVDYRSYAKEFVSGLASMVATRRLKARYDCWRSRCLNFQRVHRLLSARDGQGCAKMRTLPSNAK